jgi:signal transduction histidine kinase
MERWHFDLLSHPLPELSAMRKSPTKSAILLSLVYLSVAGVWAFLVHVSLNDLMISPRSYFRYDLPIDIVLACLTALLLFLLSRHEFTVREQANEALQKSHDELELRVQQRTYTLNTERTKLLRIMDTMPDGICIINQDFDVEYVNPAMEKQWGPVQGRKCHAYFDDQDEPCQRCPVSEGLRGQTTRREWFFEKACKTYDLVSTPMEGLDGTTRILEVFHDITERRAVEREQLRLLAQLQEAQTELEARARELAALLDISNDLNATLLSRPLLELILDHLKTMIAYTGATIVTSQDDRIVVVAYRGLLPREEIVGTWTSLEQVPGFLEVLRCREPVIIDDLQSEAPLSLQIAETAGQEVLPSLGTSRAWLGVPLMTKDRVIGLLRLDHLTPGYFTPRHAQLALAIANHAAIALENARLYEEAGKVATMEEQQRLALELHDSVSQALYGIALGTHAAREQLDCAPDKLQGTLDYILALSETAVAQVRALVYELRPDSIEQEQLVTALSRLAGTFAARDGIAVRLDLGEEPYLSLAAKEAFYRVAQEALRNVIKHANAKTIELRLCADDEWIILEVQDDGIGFDPTGRFPGHLGLQSMRERVARLGGELEIESCPSQGTRLRARVPHTAPN